MTEVSSAVRTPSLQRFFGRDGSTKSSSTNPVLNNTTSHTSSEQVSTSSSEITELRTSDLAVAPSIRNDNLNIQKHDTLPFCSNDSRTSANGIHPLSNVAQNRSGTSSIPSPQSGTDADENIKMDSRMIACRLASIGTSQDEVMDMICVGFGPASLAIAIALADTCAALPASSRHLPRILFLEKQTEFAWHAGMQLPEAKMQISFMKDLATPRDPTSPFSFINYLFNKGRLQAFINLGTFLPARKEYEDYLRWCAEHFNDSVLYSHAVDRVEQDEIITKSGKVKSFKVFSNGQVFRARHVVIAAGGTPFVPDVFEPFTFGKWPRARHSSQYATAMHALDKVRSEPEKIRRALERATDSLYDVAGEAEANGDFLAYDMIEELCKASPGAVQTNGVQKVADSERKNLEEEITRLQVQYNKLRHGLESVGLGEDIERFVVIGGGQSAAEIFCDLWSKYPKAEILLIHKGTSLRPSDDSPFVNEIFDPDRVDGIYSQGPRERQAALQADRATNYGVVRINLLEDIYYRLYLQRVTQPDENKWRVRILPNRSVISAADSTDGKGLDLKIAPTNEIWSSGATPQNVEEIKATMVFVATGYVRNAHEEILSGTKHLLPGTCEGKFTVARNYRVQYDSDKVDRSAGVWLQGCNETTHGLSDTLLSILAVRGGEMVQSIFGEELEN